MLDTITLPKELSCKIIAWCHVIGGANKESLYELLADEYPTVKIDYQLKRLQPFLLKQVGTLFFPISSDVGQMFFDLNLNYFTAKLESIND